VATKTLTVVFTDLANYTASTRRADREGLRNLIATHEKLVPPVLERYGGRVVKNLGDSYMALFPAATDAVRACLELVETIPNGGQFSIRAGLATGDVEEIDGDAFGDAVNLASRILSKAPDTEVWFSQATLLCMNQSEIAWETVGRYQLKGIPGEVELTRAVPKARGWLPDAVVEATRSGRLVRIQRGDPLPKLPPRPAILLEGFTPGSEALRSFVDRLPVVDPACLWLLTYNIPPEDRHAWVRSGRGLIIGTPNAIDQAIRETSRPSSSTGSDTIILDVSATAVVELVMAGLALPRVPMSEVVAGYTYDLLPDGRWVNRSDAGGIARVDVSPEGVTLVAQARGLRVGTRQAAPGQPLSLQDGDEIGTPSGTLVYRSLEGRPYVGMILADTMARLSVAPGQEAEIGREPNYPGLALPDRRGQDNIRWCLGSRAARARESGFTLDRALAGRRQCAVLPGSDGIRLVGLHTRCPTWFIGPNGPDQVSSPRAVEPGDHVVVGTTVIAVRAPSS
jgi:class 3 adenylate cyclase